MRQQVTTRFRADGTAKLGHNMVVFRVALDAETDHCLRLGYRGVSKGRGRRIKLVSRSRHSGGRNSCRSDELPQRDSSAEFGDYPAMTVRWEPSGR